MRRRVGVLVGAVMVAGVVVGSVVWVAAQETGRAQSSQSASPDGIRLSLSVADSIVRPGQPIELRTTLESVADRDRLTFDAAGWTPVLHVVRAMEQDGSAHAIGWNLDCSGYELGRGEVRELPLRLWAAIDDSDPDGAVGRELLSHDDLRLPFGRWAIDAVMRYYPEAGCEGPETWIQATVIVKVEGAPWPEASPAAG